MQTSSKQVQFFETFGFLKLPQILTADLPWINSEFEKVFTDRGIVHDGSKQVGFVPFIDSREKLATLLDHPAIVNAVGAVLGDDFNYLGSDGNYYKGNTAWHPDGNHPVGRYIKVAIYLDPLRRENGALQVFPRSCREADIGFQQGAPGQAEELWGVLPSELPSVALDTDPGDVLIFNHNIWHASFGGNSFRRMFTMNLGARAKTPEEIEEFKNYLRAHLAPWGERAYSDIMLKTAGPERMKHLEQVLEYEHVLVEHRKKDPTRRSAF